MIRMTTRITTTSPMTPSPVPAIAKTTSFLPPRNPADLREQGTFYPVGGVKMRDPSPSWKSPNRPAA
jgi:hypothetical protein